MPAKPRCTERMNRSNHLTPTSAHLPQVVQKKRDLPKILPHVGKKFSKSLKEYKFHMKSQQTLVFAFISVGKQVFNLMSL